MRQVNMVTLNPYDNKKYITVFCPKNDTKNIQGEYIVTDTQLINLVKTDSCISIEIKETNKYKKMSTELLER